MTVRAVLTATALSLANAGCFSSPRPPPPSPRIAEISDHGRLKFVRDGKVIDGGMFGGGLVEAVRGNPDAEQSARTYARRNAAGRSIMTVSAAVALTAILAFYDSDSDSWSILAPAGNVIVGCSIVGFWSGLVLYRNAQTYRYDAINIYNSSVDTSAPSANARPSE